MDFVAYSNVNVKLRRVVLRQNKNVKKKLFLTTRNEILWDKIISKSLSN